MRSCATCLLFGLSVVGLSGCGSSGLAPVKGRVTCNGRPVDGAVVMFSPIPAHETDREAGKAGSGGTDSDGYFSVSTYRKGDGALVGRHRVVVTLDDTVRSACRGKVLSREVKPGTNEFDIELND